MARVGEFTGGQAGYGQPLSYKHPIDNDFNKGRFAPRLLAMDISDSKRVDLQERIDELFAVLRGERDLL
jgi:hypothetical protein